MSKTASASITCMDVSLVGIIRMLKKKKKKKHLKGGGGGSWWN